MVCECVFKSCLLNSTSSGLLVIPGVSTLPCLPLMLSLKTIILKYPSSACSSSLPAVCTVTLSWGHFISSDIVDLIEQTF